MTATIHDFCEFRAKRSKARHVTGTTAAAIKFMSMGEVLDKDFDDYYAEAIAAVAFTMANE